MPPSDDESTTRIVCCDEGCYRHAHAVNHKVRRKGRQAREEEKTALSLSLSLWVAARKMAVLQLWETLKLAITAYTGLSPATFFTILAVAFALYHALSGMFSFPAPPPRRTVEEKEDREPLPPPVQLGEITEEELRAYDGSDPKKPLLMAIKGQIYDVSQSRMFYGPGGPYALFAGRDASRALAKMSFEEKDLTGDIEGLGPFELDALQDWQYRFMGKYAKVGTIKKNTAPVTESDAGLATNSSARSEIAETVENPSENLKPKDGASTTDEAQG